MVDSEGARSAEIIAERRSMLAYHAAFDFLEALERLLAFSHEEDSGGEDVAKSRRAGFAFARGFLAWNDLTNALTPRVREQVRRVYPPGSPSIKLGGWYDGASVYQTTIEAIDGELGLLFRNSVYENRRHPLEPDTERIRTEALARATERRGAKEGDSRPIDFEEDFRELIELETQSAIFERLGIQRHPDAILFMRREWESLSRSQVEAALADIRLVDVDFVELNSQLRRERVSVTERRERRAEQRASDDRLLSELEAMLVKSGGASNSLQKARDADADLSDFRPLGYFKNSLQNAIRKASRKDRKTKRVDSVLVDGVKFYCLSQVREFYGEGVEFKPLK